MVFNSDVFLFLFFPIVFALFWAMRTKEQRYVLLTLSGYIFYGYWNWRFCFLLLFSSLVSYVTAIAVEKTDDRRRKRAWMTLSIVVDLSLLGFFKYYNFFAESLNAVAPRPLLPILHIVLPIGISFYTFHTISYIVDVTRGQVKAARNLFEYFTYVCLFSQLVAGPIVRYRQIEQDLEHIDDRPDPDQLAVGIGYFVVGMLKKVIIADNIALVIDPMLGDWRGLSMGGAWLAALGYTFQLYYDFSGYSDMAVGLGHLFGLRIPQNFNSPYRALGIGDFWRRWHISLSSWLRDYLYISLGGNRRGNVRTNINLLLTMLLGGLWHGASWTFVLWGAYHGVLLIVDRELKPVLERLPTAVYRALTFVQVIVGWVLFRASDFPMAAGWLARMFGRHGFAFSGMPMRLLLLCGGCLFAANALPETWDLKFPTRRRWAVAWAVGLYVVYLFMNDNKTVFLYYQF